MRKAPPAGGAFLVRYALASEPYISMTPTAVLHRKHSSARMHRPQDLARPPGGTGQHAWSWCQYSTRPGVAQGGVWPLPRAQYVFARGIHVAHAESPLADMVCSSPCSVRARGVFQHLAGPFASIYWPRWRPGGVNQCASQ
jgi:hypothetical protein